MARKVRPLLIAGTPTHDRPDMYAELVANMKPQVDHFITVSHNAPYATGDVIEYADELPNLAVMWNAILDRAHELAKGRPYYVAILNDDALVADDWFARMVEAIETQGVAGASTPRSHAKARSIFGGAFVIKGGLDIRMSGVTRWWYTDDEIQKLCQANGGFAIVPGVQAINRLANISTAQSNELKAINSEDWPRFVERYGMPESPWEVPEYHVIISAPSGKKPKHIIDTLDGREYSVMRKGWEPEQLAKAARTHSRIVYIKESARPLPGFWEAIDRVRGSAWLFARPSCYMGVFESPALLEALSHLEPTNTKDDSIRNEWLIHDFGKWPALWPEINDYNALRMDGDELVIGNHLIEKSKGTARCGQCAHSTAPGVCEHLQARVR